MKALFLRIIRPLREWWLAAGFSDQDIIALIALALAALWVISVLWTLY